MTDLDGETVNWGASGGGKNKLIGGVLFDFMCRCTRKWQISV